MQIRGLSTVAALTLLSRILGLVRDTGMAVLFGAGPLLDAFSLAFRLPNLARRLFGEGALTTAFLPQFLRADKEDADHGRRLVWSMISLLAVSLVAAVLVIEAVVLLVMRVASPEVQFLAEMIGWLFPYVLFICVAAQFAAVLHARERFFWPAMLPIVLNGLWLIAIFVAPNLREDQSDQMRFVAVSVLAAGAVQCAICGLAVSAAGLKFRRGDLTDDRQRTKAALRIVIATMIPTLVGLTVSQINVVVDSALAWTLSPSSGVHQSWQLVDSGTASALYLGQRLFQFPLGVFGVALGTVLFPQLARHAQASDDEAYSEVLTRGLRLSFAIGVPASLGLVMLAMPIPRLLFEYREFDAEDTLQTGKMIAAYGAGVWAAVALLIVNRGFYAAGDTSTPLRAGLWAVSLNLVFDAIFLLRFGGYGLALATTCATVFQLAYSMRKLRSAIDGSALWTTAVKTAVATIAMTLAIELVNRVLPESTGRSLALLAPMCAGILVYTAAAAVVRLNELMWLVQRGTKSDHSLDG